MSTLTGQQAFEAGYLSPADETLIQPASIDVRLDRMFLSFPTHPYGGVIDPACEQPDLFPTYVPRGDAFRLNPGTFVLASTFEVISLPGDVCAQFAGKSSLARLGLGVHVTAGFIDPGFTGQITIELANVNSIPILLHPGMKIGQIVFERLEQPASVLYGSAGNNYQGQRGPTPYRGYKNFRKGLPDELVQ